MRYFKYALYCLLLVGPQVVRAQSLEVENDIGSVGAYGGIGLLEMRNARFSADGDLSIGIGHSDDGQNYYATWQATPWLETTLRFSDYDNVFQGVDKAIDVKVRLMQEGNYRPALAIGLQDMLGDGLFGGEYIVASKKIRNFDVTMGFGFGNMAGRAKVYNITRVFNGGFKHRSFDDTGSEKLRFSNYFSGENMGFFWGVEYKSPIEGLTAKVEYSTVDKSDNHLFEDYKSKTAFNFGLNYKVKNWLEVGGGLLHGNQFGLHITLRQSLHKPVRLGFDKGPDVDEIRARNLRTVASNARDFKDSSDQDIIFERLARMGYDISAIDLSGEHIKLSLTRNDRPASSAQAVWGAVLEKYSSATIDFSNHGASTTNRETNVGRAALEAFHNSATFARENNQDEGDRAMVSESIINRMNERQLKPLAVTIEDREVTVEKHVGPFNELPKNIGRTVRILTNEAPDNVEQFTIISKERGVDVAKISLLRQDFEKIADFNSSPEEILANATIDDPANATAQNSSSLARMNFDFGLLPDVVTHFGSDKNDHFKGEFNLKLFARLDIGDGIEIYGEAKQHVIGNLDLIPASDNPDVAHVRSDIGRYAAEGTTSISRLTVEYVNSPLKNTFARLTAGHLEQMYSGVSGELLYRPYDSNIGFGVDVNYVKQRGFDQMFDMRSYSTVTGHASAYYVNQKYDITTKVSFGRYLAQDWGTTIDLYRQFKNGIRIGAKATFTNMSHSDFGRGNFDKGLYMTVPLDFFWFKQSREKMKIEFRRLGKNGGQKLDLRTGLFDLMSASQPHRLRNDWNNILE